MTHLSEVSFCVYDLETTGLDPVNDRIVEIAGKNLKFDADGRLRGMGFFQSLVDPLIPIPVEVTAIHHIKNSDLVDAPTWEDVTAMLPYEVDAAKTIFAAHNGAGFDDLFVKEYQPFTNALGFVDTKRLAQHLYPEAPAYGNQALRYYFDLDVDTMGGSPHRALADVIVTAAILDVLLMKFIEDGYEPTVEALIELSNKPVLYTTWPFGQYYSKPLSVAPDDYLSYCLRKMELKPDVRYSLQHELDSRSNQGRMDV